MHAPEPLRLFKPAIPQPARLPHMSLPREATVKAPCPSSPHLCLPIHLVLPHAARCDVVCPPPLHQELRVANYLFFFFLMCIIFKVVIEFITILFLLYVLVFLAPRQVGF